MKIIKFLVALAATVGLTVLLNNNFNVKGLPFPAFGKLLSPFEGYWHNGEPLTKSIGGMTVGGLTANAKVVYDDRQIPHIFAENDADAVFIQGYLHAQNRLWEMEFIARAAGGQLSEVLGDRILRGAMTTVDVDKLMRRRGNLADAVRTVEEWKKDAETWSLVEAYCKGANTFIKPLQFKDYPIEYKIFGVAPTDWTPLKMALIQKYMAMDLAAGENDVAATNAKPIAVPEVLNGRPPRTSSFTASPGPGGVGMT